jgi:molybdate transport system substrate-binding protein
MVGRGDTPLGIVYVTDALASSKVKIVGVFPASSHAPILYPAAIVKGADTPPADDYFRFLRGADAHAIFARYGFATP